MAISMEFGKTVFDKNVDSKYPSDTHKNVLLRQPVMTYYGTSNSTKDSLFADDKGTGYPSSRTVILRVPLSKSEKDIQNALDSNPNCRIWKTTSNEPILTEELKAAIVAGRTTIDAIANNQRSRLVNANGELVDIVDKRNNKPVYHLHGFSTTAEAHEDVDLRVYSEAEEKAFAERVAAEKAAKMLSPEQLA
jgi:hypothetical protein